MIYPRSCCIYLITNLLNGKQYVGQTTRGDRRWQVHINQALCNEDQTYRLLYVERAMRKYGVDNFKYEVIEPVPIDATELLLDEREAYWIIKLDTLAPNGYNLAAGSIKRFGVKRAAVVGQAIGNALRGKKKNMSVEGSRRLSEARKRNGQSPEARRKQSITQTGRKQSEETKTKRSAALKGRKTGPCSEERKAAIRAGMAARSLEAKQKAAEAARVFMTGRAHPHTPEWNAKIAAAHIGMKHTDETKKKLSEIQIGQTRGSYSPERVAAMRAAWTPERREALSAKMRERRIPKDGTLEDIIKEAVKIGKDIE